MMRQPPRSNSTDNLWPSTLLFRSHNPDGNWLYGMEGVVHPDYRGMRIGQRLYQARKRLCMDLKLRGIVSGGRIPGLAKNLARYGNAEAYAQAVIDRKRTRLNSSHACATRRPSSA